MVSDFTALFRCQAGLVDVFGLAVLAESSDAHGRSHMLRSAGYALGGMKRGENAQGELAGEESLRTEWLQVINASGERSHSTGVIQVTSMRLLGQSPVRNRTA